MGSGLTGKTTTGYGDESGASNINADTTKGGADMLGRTDNVRDIDHFIKCMKLRYVEGEGYAGSEPIDLCNIMCLLEIIDKYEEEYGKKNGR